MQANQITPEVLHKAAEMYVEGRKAKEIQVATGLNHSQAAWVRYVIQYYYVDGGEVVEATGENVEALYDYHNVSVGGIMTMLGVNPETGLWAYSASAIEKLYSDRTGYTLKGQRCGKGGAFLKGDSALYEDTLRAKGTKLEPSEVPDPDRRHAASVRTAAIKEALKMEPKDLRADIKALGGTAKANATKAVLAREWADLRAVVVA